MSSLGIMNGLLMSNKQKLSRAALVHSWRQHLWAHWERMNPEPCVRTVAP